MSRSKLSLSLLRGALIILGAAASLTACKGESTATAEDALTAVKDSQKTCQNLGSAAHQCFATLHSCVQGAAGASAAAACKTAFSSCLPPDAPAHAGPDGDHHGGGHPGGGHPGGHFGGHPGGSMAGGCPGMDGGSNACNPSAPVVQSCNQDLVACLDAGNAAAGCVSKADACVASSIQARFGAMCEAHAAQCNQSGADSAICDQLESACKAGVTLPEASPITLQKLPADRTQPVQEAQ